MIDFRHIKGDQAVVDYIVNRLSERLNSGQRLLWLVAGGSAMVIAAKAAKDLGGRTDLNRLSISLTDERYGPIGHADSNWRQLAQKGFSLPGAQLVPVLTGQSPADTAQNFANNLNQALEDHDFSLALAGMGPDGHIFGIKPSSPAVNSDKSVVAYDWEDYHRITPTIKLIQRLDEVVMYAVGKEKQTQIDKLDMKLDANEQPAQLLKRLKKVVFFNDYKGGRSG